jgi:hypothetical protein
MVIHLHKITTTRYSALLMNTNWITEVWEHLYTCKATVDVDGL